MCCPGKVFVKESMLSSIKLHQGYAVFGINSHSNFWDNTVATVYQNKLNIYKNRVLSQLERMQQYLAGFFAHISGPETSILYNVHCTMYIYAVASAPTVTGSVFYAEDLDYFWKRAGRQ